MPAFFTSQTGEAQGLHLGLLLSRLSYKRTGGCDDVGQIEVDIRHGVNIGLGQGRHIDCDHRAADAQHAAACD